MATLLVPPCRRVLVYQRSTVAVQRNYISTGRGSKIRGDSSWDERSRQAEEGSAIFSFSEDAQAQKKTFLNSTQNGKPLEKSSKIYEKFMEKKASIIDPERRQRKGKMKEVPDQSSRLVETHWSKTPILNMSPFLKVSQLYSQRLDLLKVLRNDPTHHSYLLAYHGVPPELLQDHILLAYNLLKDEDTVKCSFDNYLGGEPNCIYVGGRDGIEEDRQWPLKGGDNLQNQMELYLTVMKRLASYLGLVFFDDNEHRKYNATPPIIHWSVSFSQENFNSTPLVPIAGLTFRQRTNDPDSVSILLHGFHESGGDSQNKYKTPLTLTFKASFHDTS